MSGEGKPSKEAKMGQTGDTLKAKGGIDPLVARRTFPDAAAVFAAPAKSLQQIKNGASIVLDTNALLVPYGLGSHTLKQLELTYRRLITEHRLVIPAQVAREFAKNRATKLAELFQRLSQKRDKIQSFRHGNYPLLESLDQYTRLCQLEESIDRLVDDYRSVLGSVIDHVRAWEWNDPVSLLYGQLFSAEVVFDTTRTADEIHEEHHHRLLHKIPPGYKDEAKDDLGIGDLLIWLTIIDLGAARRTSVIFVSGEEKADWWHRGDRQPLYPRFELVDEFRRSSGGNSFHIIKFSQLLELFGASETVVAEVKKEETRTPTVATKRRALSAGMIAEHVVEMWLVRNGWSVTRALDHRGYDFLAEKDGAVVAFDATSYEGGGMFRQRLAHRVERHRQQHLSVPLTIVVVASTEELAAKAEGMWSQFDTTIQLVAGVLVNNEFRPTKGQ